MIEVERKPTKPSTNHKCVMCEQYGLFIAERTGEWLCTKHMQVDEQIMRDKK